MKNKKDYKSFDAQGFNHNKLRKMFDQARTEQKTEMMRSTIHWTSKYIKINKWCYSWYLKDYIRTKTNITRNFQAIKLNYTWNGLETLEEITDLEEQSNQYIMCMFHCIIIQP